MPKRIYVPLRDPRAAADVARKTGIDRKRLEQAGRGEIELTPDELRKLDKVLKVQELDD